MVWFYVDDVLPFHERVLRAGNAAMGLWVRAGAWSSGQLTDGRIPAEVARQMGTAAEIRRLVDVGLWVSEDGGYRFHAWAEDGTGQKRQPTKAEVEEKRRKERERKAAYRARDTPPPAPGNPAAVPTSVPAGHPADVREESRGASDYPYPALPNQGKEIPIEIPSGISISPEQTADAARSGPSEQSTEIALITPPTRSGYPAAFEDFWHAYPRHEGKRKALTAWQAARRRAGSEQAILDGARRYAADPNRDPAYTAHPTTWLNRDGWDDAPLPQRRPASQQEKLEQSSRDTIAALHRMGVAG
jgi:hypothetical protein